MTRSAKIEAFLGEGNFEFLLAIGQLRELEERRVEAMARLGHPVGQGSIMAIMARLENLTAPIVEVMAVLQLGLVGAGMDKATAFNLVERHVRPPDLKSAYLIALAALGAAWVGVPSVADGEADGSGEPKGRAKASSSPTARRAGAGSTKSAGRSTTRRKSSTAASSGS